MGHPRDLFLHDCAQRIAALINSSPRSPCPQDIVNEIAAALDAPGLHGYMLSRNDYVDKDYGPDELKQLIRKATVSGLSHVIWGVDLADGAEQLEKEAEVDLTVVPYPPLHRHFGDPCIHCGVPHDDVPPGPCRGTR